MLYVIGRWLCTAFFRLLFRLRVEGAENVPESGGVLLIANHASYLDPPLLGCAVVRRVYFMAKAELFRIPLLGPLLPRVGAFPVQRGGADRRAVRTAIELLKQGHAVGIFPEGTRTRTGELLPFQSGAGMIALRAGARVVPVALIGSFKPFKGGLIPKRLTVRIGRPIDLSGAQGLKSSKESLEYVNGLMRTGIEELLRKASP